MLDWPGGGGREASKNITEQGSAWGNFPPLNKPRVDFIYPKSVILGKHVCNLFIYSANLCKSNFDTFEIYFIHLFKDK